MGGPIREVAEFEPPAPATVTNGGFFASTPSWLILAAVGFVVGMVLGLMVFRRRKAGGGGGMDRESPTSSVSEFGSGAGTYGDREASAPSISEVSAEEPMDNPGADQ